MTTVDVLIGARGVRDSIILLCGKCKIAVADGTAQSKPTKVCPRCGVIRTWANETHRDAEVQAIEEKTRRERTPPVGRSMLRVTDGEHKGYYVHEGYGTGMYGFAIPGTDFYSLRPDEGEASELFEPHGSEVRTVLERLGYKLESIDVTYKYVK